MAGVTGIAARFTIAMNVKTGKEIGHPSSQYIWDIISVVDGCFSTIGIQCEIFIAENFSSRARKTSAKSKRKLPPFVHKLNKEIYLSLKKSGNPLIFAISDGSWYYSNTGLYDIEKMTDMPFGPIIIKVTACKEVNKVFPKNTLNYLINTLERGEEPMEIVGEGNYSAVSGWKAFARWLQVYTIPLPKIRHSYLDTLINLLFQRRIANVKYWEYMSSILDNQKEIELSNRLHDAYLENLANLKDIIENGDDYVKVRNIYFVEQKTLPVYKDIRNYLRDE